MRVKRIEWINDVTYLEGHYIETTSYDLHLIPGAEIAPSLLKIIESDYPPSSTWASAITDDDKVSVEFDPRITLLPVGGSNFIGWGIAINTHTGWLRIADPLSFPTPPDRLYNFIVEAKVTDNNTDPPTIKTSAIRIHIHDSIKSAWLTPSELNVREGTDNLRFSILAEFNNQVSGENFPIMGDISTYPGIEWERVGPGFVAVDPHNGHLIPQPSAAPVTIRAKLPSPFNVVGVRDAKVNVQKSWSLLPAKVKPVPKRKISESSIHKFPNILFIPDGFKDEDGEEVLFEKLVEGIVSKIRKNGSLIPFNLFTKNKKINYWRAFIPSSEWGTSVLNSMEPITHTNTTAVGKIDYKYPPFAVKPDIESEEKWNLQELIYVVGLPLLFDNRQPNDDQTYMDKLNNWKVRFNRDDIIKPLPEETTDPIKTWKRKVPIELWKKWKRIGRYVLLADERNTALGVAKGHRPSVLIKLDDERDLNFHPFRTTREHLDKFLINLKADGITDPIGKIWGPTDDHDPPVDQDKGKDRIHVFVLCRGSPSAGSSIRYPPNQKVALSLSEDTEVQLKHGTASLECEIVPNKLPDLANLSPLLIGDVIHELSHTFQLNDEYGGGDSMPDDLNDSRKLWGNVQPRSELLSGVSPGISSRNIKWRWHRIEKVGVLVQNPIQPDLSVQEFFIELEPGQAGQFHRDEHVFLRQRPLIKDPPSITSPELIVFADPAQEIVPVKVKDAGEEVKVNDFPGRTGNPQSDASILFRPRPSTIDPPFFERIVHKKILDQIDISGGPLNAHPDNPMRDCVAYVRAHPELGSTQIQTPHFSLPIPSSPIFFTELIIGLYEGGKGYHCNVYHPAGMCLMGRGDDADTSFCHVCRYILVDVIDPSSHSKIDEMYGKDYSKI